MPHASITNISTSAHRGSCTPGSSPMFRSFQGDPTHKNVSCFNINIARHEYRVKTALQRCGRCGMVRSTSTVLPSTAVTSSKRQRVQDKKNDSERTELIAEDNYVTSTLYACATASLSNKCASSDASVFTDQAKCGYSARFFCLE